MKEKKLCLHIISFPDYSFETISLMLSKIKMSFNIKVDEVHEKHYCVCVCYFSVCSMIFHYLGSLNH